MDSMVLARLGRRAQPCNLVLQVPSSSGSDTLTCLTLHSKAQKVRSLLFQGPNPGGNIEGLNPHFSRWPNPNFTRFSRCSAHQISYNRKIPKKSPIEHHFHTFHLLRLQTRTIHLLMLKIHSFCPLLLNICQVVSPLKSPNISS